MRYNYFKIPVFVKPVIWKYVVANYGDVILLENGERLSINLFSLLQKDTKLIKNIPWVLDKDKEKLTKKVIIVFARGHSNHHGLSITKKHFILINNFFELEILKLIFKQCKTYAKMKLSRHLAIQDFCKQYNIDIGKDIALKSILTAVSRYTQHLKDKKSRVQLPTLSSKTINS